VEPLASPPTDDNDLAESRRNLDRGICSKGNLCLGILRDGTPEQVSPESRKMVNAVRGYPHMFSTTDSVPPETPLKIWSLSYAKSSRAPVRCEQSDGISR